MEYISTKEASEKWGKSLRLVQGYCVSGKIRGAKRMGKQWMVPANAICPTDKRYRNAAAMKTPGEYHFPLLTYTKWYEAPEELCEDELSLLDAQVLHLKLRNVDCIDLCQDILDKSSMLSVKIGAYATIAISDMLLGQYGDMQRNLRAAEKLSALDPEHEEDYKLLVECVQLQITRDPSKLLAIDRTKLSNDALHFYTLLLIEIAIFEVSPESCTTLAVYEAFCAEMKVTGVAPAECALHGILARLYHKHGDATGETKHIEEMCRLSVPYAWISFVTKYSANSFSKYEAVLQKYDATLVNEVRLLQERSFYNWQLCFNLSKGNIKLPDVSVDDGEFMLLLLYDLSIDVIAKIKGLSDAEVLEWIRKLEERLEVNSLDELKEKIREEFF